MVDALVAQLPGDPDPAAALSRMRVMKMKAVNAFEAQAKHLVSEQGLPTPPEAKKGPQPSRSTCSRSFR
eukprot:3565503-Prymnesium_polylepis.1